MLNTGFYNIVTAKEGERYIERQADREQQATLREEALRRLKEQGIDVVQIIREQEERNKKHS